MCAKTCAEEAVEVHDAHFFFLPAPQAPTQAPAERQAIFGRFVRGQAAVNTRGSGIGLAVVQLLMEAMAGIVMVADAPGGGADFQLHLPLFEVGEPTVDAGNVLENLSGEVLP